MSPLLLLVAVLATTAGVSAAPPQRPENQHPENQRPENQRAENQHPENQDAAAATVGTTDPDGTPAASAMVRTGPTPSLVNLNTATVEQLCTLPGVGPKKAEAIIALRQRRPFTRVTQLLQVKGIGPKTLKRLKPHLVVTSD